MSFAKILDTVFLGPLKLIFELLFSFAYQFTGNVGFTIILLSLAINVLVLPLYRCADAMQERARDKEIELHDGIAHIKKTFKGNERMMMLQTYYRQNDYSPFSALSGSVSLLLEIPFFMAAYQFLSNVAVLKGASLGPIANLANPDALITIGGFSINVLPILMTAINIVTSVLFLKGAPLKSKLQLYILAAFFLVFLYDSPAGLVFYWTLNNVFSLVKTIVLKLKRPKRAVSYLISALGIAFFIAARVFLFDDRARITICALIMVACQIPLAIALWNMFAKKERPVQRIEKTDRAAPTPNKKIFVLGCVFLTLLLGVFIPAEYIGSQPQEFISGTYYMNPVWFVVGSACLAGGTFLLWFGVFYWIAPPKGKVWFDRVVWIASVVMLADYFFFGKNLGNISADLQYDNGLIFRKLEYILNSVVVLALVVGLFFVVVKFRKVTTWVLAISLLSLSGVSMVNVTKIVDGVRAYDASQVNDDMPSFELSKNGRNVVVIMLDRALGSYFPYVLQDVENRQAAEGKGEDFLSGFTYYSNVVSFGSHTNFATPALLGGYEYTPVELNKRSAESLKSKQNEANLVMPRIFTEANGEQAAWAEKAYVFDPIYTNYQWISDLSVYDAYDKIEAENILGTLSDAKNTKSVVKSRYRDFFCFGLMKSLPVVLQKGLYDGSMYHKVNTRTKSYGYTTQAIFDRSNAVGIDRSFMDNYDCLDSLEKMTVTAESGNRFMFMTNNLTHEEMMLDAKTYSPVTASGDLRSEVDNSDFDAKHEDRFVLSGTGKMIKVNSGFQMSTYQTNVCALLTLEKWFDYLKEENLYDNTRIILVSDHGYMMDSVEELRHEKYVDTQSGTDSLEPYFPLLLVKDFNATGSVTVSDAFMTNADVPYLATKDVIETPINPFTGKQITMDEKYAHPQYLINSAEYHPAKNNGNQFKSAKWVSVQDNIWNLDNWKIYNHKTVLTEHNYR